MFFLPDGTGMGKKGEGLLMPMGQKDTELLNDLFNDDAGDPGKDGSSATGSAGTFGAQWSAMFDKKGKSQHEKKNQEYQPSSD